MVSMPIRTIKLIPTSCHVAHSNNSTTPWRIDRGWSAYFTVHSLEKNVTTEGDPKIDLNAEDLQTLHGELQQALGAAEANFIIAFRQYGASGDTLGETASEEATGAEEMQVDFEKAGETQIESMLDLIGVQVTIENEEGDNENDNVIDDAEGDSGEENSQGNDEGQTLESPWQDDLAPSAKPLPSSLTWRRSTLANVAEGGSISIGLRFRCC